MKKYFYLLIASVIILNGCHKLKNQDINPSDGTGGAPYQPFSANSYWKYTAITGSQTAHTAITMTGGTSVFNSKTYYTASETSDQANVPTTGYFYYGDHVYSTRSTTMVYGVTIDMQYLNDNLPAGGTWTASLTDDGLVNGVPARTVNSIKEVNISKNISGKTYSNVIHSQVDLQYDYGFGFTSAGIYDFYAAKNVGIIEIDSNLSTFGFTLTSTEVLTDYSIK